MDKHIADIVKNITWEDAYYKDNVQSTILDKIKIWCAENGVDTNTGYSIEILKPVFHHEYDKPVEFVIRNGGPSLNSDYFFGDADKLERHIKEFNEVRPLYHRNAVIW